MRLFHVDLTRRINRIYVSHTVHATSLAIVGVYIPIFLLVIGYSLTQTVLFFVVMHLAGLLSVFFLIVPLIQRSGLLAALKFSYLLQIVFFALLNALPYWTIPLWSIAVVGGLATFFYWIPLNILLVRNTDAHQMGSDLSLFFALPQIFGIAGPLLSALLVPLIGFWPMFLVTALGLAISYLPLAGIKETGVSVALDLKSAWEKLRTRKGLFFLEGLDNIVEESEWFWGIYVFLLVGSLSAPGIVGALAGLGGAAFTILVGAHANKHAHTLVIAGALGLVLVWGARFFIETPLAAYVVSLVASFVMTLFVVSYFSTIYRAVKTYKKDEAEFIILREIPTVLGRMVVFGGILLAAQNPSSFFFLPIVVALCIFGVFIIFRSKIKKMTTALDSEAA